MIQEESLRRKLQKIYYPDCAIDRGTLILLLPLERLRKFIMSEKSLIKHGFPFGKFLSATPIKRLGKIRWLEIYKNHVHQLPL